MGNYMLKQTFFNKMNNHMSAKKADELVKQFLQTNKDKVKVVPFGFDEANLSTIGINCTAESALFEPVTNGLDSWAELQVALNSDTAQADSPADLINNYVGIDLEQNIHRKDRTKIATGILNIERSMYSDPKEHCISITDYAMGMTPEEMKNGILSLHTSNKYKKPYLMGKFGQGGSTSLGFSHGGTLIASRKYNQDEIGFTFVFKKDATASNPRSMYMMLVEKDTDLPLQINARDITNPIDCGTKVINYDYELSGLFSNTNVNSPYHAFRTMLPDVELPIMLHDNTKNYKSGGSSKQHMIGSFKVLANKWTENDGHDGKSAKERAKLKWMSSGDAKGFVEIPVGNGFIKIRAWVLAPKKDDGMSRRGDFFNENTCAVFTLCGQNQGEFDARSKLFNTYPFLNKHMIVQIKCDGLTFRQKDQLFSTTREGIKSCGLSEKIRKSVKTWLDDNAALNELNTEAKENSMKNSINSNGGIELLKELGMVGGVSKAGGKLDSGKQNGGRQVAIYPKKKTVQDGIEDIWELYDNPTVIDFYIKDENLLRIQKDDTRRYIECWTDAADSLDHLIKVDIQNDGGNTGKGLVFVERTKLHNGKFKITVDASDSRLKDKGKIVISLNKLSAEREFLVTTTKSVQKGSKGKKGKAKLKVDSLPEVSIVFVDENGGSENIGMLLSDCDANSNCDTYNTAAYAVYDPSDNTVICYCSTDFYDYRQAMKKAGKREESLKLFKERFNTWVQVHCIQNIDKADKKVVTNWNATMSLILTMVLKEIKG